MRSKYRRLYFLTIATAVIWIFVLLYYRKPEAIDIHQQLLEDVSGQEDVVGRGIVDEYVDAGWVSSAVLEYEKRVLPSVRVKETNCAKLFNDNRPEQYRAYAKMRQNKRPPPDSRLGKYLNMTCKDFISRRRYVTVSQSEEEASFPIAFSISMHKDVEQFEKLFRTIYRPEHVYCIHVDAGASNSIFQAVTNIGKCFPLNVIVPTSRVRVIWGTVSVLDLELTCMRLLLQRFGRWKYFINLTGQEWPLRTMLELVRVLRTLRGANSVEGTVERLSLQDFHEPLFWHIPKPHILLVKGSVHIAAQRGFIDYALRNRTSLALLNYLRSQAGYPEEKFFATLNHNPHLDVPGSYTGVPETHPVLYPFIARLKNWLSYPFDYPCRSDYVVRQICIWGIEDLPFISKRKELFANKFYYDMQYLTLECLEELFWNRTRADYAPYRKDRTGDPGFVLSDYEKLSFVQNHV